MEDPQRILPSGPIVGDDTTPKSPHGSVASRHSSTSRASRLSSHSSPKSGGVQQQQRQQQKTVFCQKHCSTVMSCLFIGVMISLGSIAMTVCGYFAVNIASQTVVKVNATEIVVNEQLHDNLYKFRTFGPVMIGFGGFLIMCACVLLCEAKDKKNKRRNNANENLLNEHDRIMEEARERFYNENRTALLLQAQAVDYRAPKTSANESTTCLGPEVVGNSIKSPRVKPLAIVAPEHDSVSIAPGSPVVLVHGPTGVEPAELMSENDHQTSVEQETTAEKNDLSSNSINNSPEHKSGSPSRNLKKNNTVTPASFEHAEVFPVPIFPVLPKIDSPRCTGGNGSSRAGGAIPKSILVQPMKLSPIRSVNGPIRVRLDDAPSELSAAVPPSALSKSSECIPLPRSPASTPARLKRGNNKKKKAALGLDAGGLGQCRCRSDPSMTSMGYPDRQADACCCLQSDCCWGENCQLEKSMPSSASTSANQNKDDPLVMIVATGDKTSSLAPQPPQQESTNVNAHTIDSKPKISEVDGIDTVDQGLDKLTTPQEDNLSTLNTDIVPNEDAAESRASPSRKLNTANNECSADGGGESGSTAGSNTDTLVVRDRNSNITVSSIRQETPGKGAPYGQSQGGVMV